MTVKIHLDTDIGGDPDDVCALALLLGMHARREVEIVGITTVADPRGVRVTYVRHVLALANGVDASGLTIAAGAPTSITTGLTPGDVERDKQLWPPAARAPAPSPPGAALDLLDRSIDAGATVVAIGMWTNLALLERARPGRLGAAASVVVMGGWIDQPAPPLPQWGPEMDWNVQCDTIAATEVVEACASSRNLTMATLAATMQAPLRHDHLPAIRATGPLGELIADQSGRQPLDVAAGVVNYHYDPVACALAAGWPGTATSRRTLRHVHDERGVLRFVDDAEGTPVDVLTGVDGMAFARLWLRALAAAQRPPPSSP